MKPSEWIAERTGELKRKHPNVQRVFLKQDALIDFLDYWQENDKTNGFLAALRRHVSPEQERDQEEHKRYMEKISKELKDYDDG